MDIYRYLVGLATGGSVCLSWRLLESDAPDMPFWVERATVEGDISGSWERLTPEPLRDRTNYEDHQPYQGTYDYRVVDGEGRISETVRQSFGVPRSNVALRVPLPLNDDVQGIIVGDLENNGRMGYVVRCARGGTIWLIAIGHEGKQLWRYDTHLPVHGGWDGSMNHCPWAAWDVNHDGRTEVLVHDYPVDGAYPTEDYSTAIDGETMTCLDGETGEVVWCVPWPAQQSRVMMTLAYLRGRDEAPCMVVQDETYGPVDLTALRGEDGGVFWQVHQTRPGGHNLDVADIDEDGVQEVICGGMCYNGDGTVRWEAEWFGHTDINKPAYIDRSLPGKQIWYAVEGDNPGVYLVDNEGRTLWKEPYRHAHFGWVARHTAQIQGLQPHTAEDGRVEYGAGDAGMRQVEHNPIFAFNGRHWQNLTEEQRKCFVPVHWDARPEVCFVMRKRNKRVVRLAPSGEIVDLPDGTLPETAVFGRNMVCVDVCGDYREEIVTVDEADNSLIVLSNMTPHDYRGYSPAETFEYLHDRSQLGSGYYLYLSPPNRIVGREYADDRLRKEQAARGVAEEGGEYAESGSFWTTRQE